MSEVFTTEYKGFKISYAEYDDIWKCDIQGKITTRQSLKSIKMAIDEFYKRENAIEPISVLYIDNYSYSGFEFGKKAIATSLAQDNGKAWFLNNNNKRKKESLNDFVLDTPENVELINKINSLNQNINELVKQKSDLLGQFITLKQSDFKEKKA